MSNELQQRYTATGSNLYATLRNAAGQMCDVSSGYLGFEAMTVAHWANYAKVLTETPASSYLYLATFPAVAAGHYFIDVYLRAGGSPAIADTKVTSYGFDWNGSTENTLASLPNTWPVGAFAATGTNGGTDIGSSIPLYTFANSVKTFTLNVVDGAGAAVSMLGVPLSFQIITLGTTVGTVETISSFTIGGAGNNQVTFTLDATGITAGPYAWRLFNTTAMTVVLQGTIMVNPAT